MRLPTASELTLSIIVVLVQLVITIRRPLDGMLTLLFFTIFIESWVEIPLGAGLPDLSFSRFSVAFLAIFMLAKAAAGQLCFARIGLIELLVLIAPIGIAVAAPLSVEPPPRGVVQMAITMHLVPLGMYILAKNLVQSRRDLHRLFWVIALLGFVSGVYAAYEFTTGNVLFTGGASVGKLYRGKTNIRMILGIWGATGKMGRAVATTIPITFYLFLERKRESAKKILLVAMLAAQFYGLVVAMSRTPWYALLLALFVMQLFYSQFRKLFIGIVIVAALVLWATWGQVTESQVAERVNDKVSTLEGRQNKWQTAYSMWRAKPIRGWGFGRFSLESERFRTDEQSRQMNNPHNDYLYILVGSGLVGFLPYLAFLLLPLVKSLYLYLKVRSPDWSGFVKVGTISVYWGVMLVLLVTSFTATQNEPVIRMMAFAVAGAVVGTHEDTLRSPMAQKSSLHPGSETPAKMPL
jgi:O-antigen ligase